MRKNIMAAMYRLTGRINLPGTALLSRVCMIIALPLTLSVGGCELSTRKPDCSDTIARLDRGAFLVSEQGLARHPNQNIEWYRCNGGQTFQNRRCVGDALHLSREDAISYAAEFTARAGGDAVWRLPTIREMQGIMESGCHNPAVNYNVFPAVEVANYWTTTPSRWGNNVGCAMYTLRGDWYCRASLRVESPFMLVRDL